MECPYCLGIAKKIIPKIYKCKSIGCGETFRIFPYLKKNGTVSNLYFERVEYKSEIKIKA